MDLKHNGLVLLGAVIGGLLGYAAFFWMARHGFYGLILPGSSFLEEGKSVSPPPTQQF